MITVKLEIHFQLKREGGGGRGCGGDALRRQSYYTKNVPVVANYTLTHSGSNINKRQVPKASKTNKNKRVLFGNFLRNEWCEQF